VTEISANFGGIQLHDQGACFDKLSMRKAFHGIHHK
jgi:hypothetical protein